MDIILIIVFSFVVLFILYIITKFIFDIFLRGFLPFISSRPWVTEKILEEIEKEKAFNDPVVYSLSCGRSGFLATFKERYPQAKLVGVENNFFSYLVSMAQKYVKREKIKIAYIKNLYNYDISTADLIYCYLDVKVLRDLPKKFKFECKPGAIIISNGLPIPSLKLKKDFELPEKKRRWAFFSRKKKIFSSKMKEGKRVNKVYFYEI